MVKWFFEVKKQGQVAPSGNAELSKRIKKVKPGLKIFIRKQGTLYGLCW